MDCKEFDLIIEAYALGELDEARARQCAEHLEVCGECRESLEIYRLLAGAIGGEPVISPTRAESADLVQALKQVDLCPKPGRQEVPVVPGFAGFVLASAIVFMTVVAVFAMQVFDVVDFGAVLGSLGYLRIAALTIVVVFVTTFVPIAMTAWRRPLNGMTFRR